MTQYFTGDDPKSLAGFVNILDAFAARGTEIRTADHAEMWLDDGHGFHAPVGAYFANPFGLHDMLGNVMEWCWDLSGRYTTASRPGTGERLTPPLAFRVLRGGSFAQVAVDARCARRWDAQPNSHVNYAGVRPAQFIALPDETPPTWKEAGDLIRREAWQHFDQGKSLGEKRQYAEAIQEFEAAVALVPDFLDARMNRGVALVLSNRREEAIAEFETIVKLKPDHAYARAKLAQALAEAGRTDEAISHYRQAFDALAQPYPELTRLLMEALAKENRLDEAIAAAQAHLRKSDPDAGFCYRYGWILWQSGRLSEAIQQFERSIALESLARRHADLASALAAHQESDEARRHFRAAIDLAPHDNSIHHEFLAFLTKQGDGPDIRAEEARWQQAVAAASPAP